MLSNPKNNFAVLLGTTRCLEDDSKLQPLPAVRHNLEQMFSVLSASLVDEDNILELRDRVGGPKTAQLIEDHLGNVPDGGGLIFYFSGHGLRRGKNLYLALENTKADSVHNSGLEFKKVAEAIRESKAEHKVVMLDCCHAGEAANEPLIGKQVKLDSSALITACRGHQEVPATDGGNPTPLTAAILAGLRGEIIGEDPTISIKELCDFLKSSFDRNDSIVTPQFLAGGPDLGSAKIAPRHAGKADYRELVRICVGVKTLGGLPQAFSDETQPNQLLIRASGALCQKILCSELLAELDRILRVLNEVTSTLLNRVAGGYLNYWEGRATEVARTTDRIQALSQKGRCWGAFKLLCDRAFGDATCSLHRIRDVLISPAEAGADLELLPSTVRDQINKALSEATRKIRRHEQESSQLYSVACATFNKSVNGLSGNVSDI